MKALLLLSLLAIGSQAAFTGSLVQQLQPQLRSIRIQYQAKSSVEINFQSQLTDAIAQTIGQTANQIEQAVNQVTGIAQELVQSVQSALVNVASAGQSALQQGHNILTNLLNSLLASIRVGNNKELSPLLIGIIQQIAGNQQIVQFIRDTQLYQCLTGRGLNLQYSNLQNLYYSGQLLAFAQSAIPDIHACVQAQGLSTILDTIRPLVGLIVNHLAALNSRDVVHNAVISIIGQELYDEYVAPVLSGKGLFGNAISAVSQSAQQLGQYIASVAQSAIQTLEGKIEEIKEQILAYVQQQLQGAQQFTQQAAQIIINALAPIKDQLGEVYHQVVDTLTGIYSQLSVL